MKREEYNQCVADGMRGKKLTRDERKVEFCVTAKVCSGKANNREEALAICNKPKLPKWAKNAKPEDDNLSCPDRMARTMQAIDTINLKVKVGEAETVKASAAQVLQDLMKCGANEAIIALAQEAMSSVNDLGKRFYLTGEAKETENLLLALKGVIQE